MLNTTAAALYMMKSCWCVSIKKEVIKKGSNQQLHLISRPIDGIYSFLYGDKNDIIMSTMLYCVSKQRPTPELITNF